MTKRQTSTLSRLAEHKAIILITPIPSHPNPNRFAMSGKLHQNTFLSAQGMSAVPVDPAKSNSQCPIRVIPFQSAVEPLLSEQVQIPTKQIKDKLLILMIIMRIMPSNSMS
jgi:hypothetical protein